jgi:3-oxoacyl-[acyl-carrier protein] reductase
VTALDHGAAPALFSLLGRRALVTGAGGALGGAVALSLAQQGAQVTVADLREDAARRVADEVGHDVLPLALDVTDPASVAACFDAAGDVDILVTAAGVGRVATFAEQSYEDWRWMVGTRLDGTFLCVRAALPSMLANGFGRIICFSSVATHGLAKQVDYAAAKAGVDGLVRSLAREVAPDGVTVNAIAPGYIASPFNDAGSGARMDLVRDSIPAGRLGRPSEIGALAVYLASDEAAFLTGEVVSPNGGFTYCAHVDRQS